MTREEIHLLFEDLSSRLPYEVWVKHPKDIQPVLLIALGKVGPKLTCRVMPSSMYTQYGLAEYDIAPSVEFVKPYLRPMSRMTKKELDELSKYENPVQRAKFYYKHQLDCNFLIEKGLAIEALDYMYKKNI